MYCQKRPTDVLKKIINKPSLSNNSTTQRAMRHEPMSSQISDLQVVTTIIFSWKKLMHFTGTSIFGDIVLFSEHLFELKKRFCPVIDYISVFKESVHWHFYV